MLPATKESTLLWHFRNKPALGIVSGWELKIALNPQPSVELQGLVHACRASLGYMSTFEDVEAFSLFLERAYKDRTVDL
jgi:selenocysteine lyase/cysteine desulfurase